DLNKAVVFRVRLRSCGIDVTFPGIAMSSGLNASSGRNRNCVSRTEDDLGILRGRSIDHRLSDVDAKISADRRDGHFLLRGGDDWEQRGQDRKAATTKRVASFRGKNLLALIKAREYKMR